MRFEHGARSVTGRRSVNQDAWMVRPEIGLFAVSDGMGGLADGEEASARSVAWLDRYATLLDRHRLRVKESPDPPAKLALLSALEVIFREASADIFQMAQRRDSSMGATLTAGLVAGQDLFVAHVGDTRIYLVRGGTTRIVTQDHSVAAERLRRGRMSRQEYDRSELRSLLYQAMGVNPEVDPDVLEVALADDDVLVLCSDGVWAAFRDDEVGELAVQGSPEQAAEALVRNAYERGATDNLTAVVVRCHSERQGVGVDWEAIFQHTPLFAGLDVAARDRLAPYLRDMNLGPGDPVVREGDRGEELFLVLDGRLLVSRQGIQLGLLEPGQHFGEIALALDCPRTASVEALTPCRLVALHRDQLDELILRRPELGALILSRLLVHMASQVLDLDARILRLETRQDR